MTETTHPTKRKTINVANSDNKNSPTKRKNINVSRGNSNKSPKNALSKCPALLQTHPKTTFSCINFIILLLAYWRFFNVHYSVDTYTVYSGDDPLGHFTNSRPLGYLAAKLTQFLNLENPETQWIVTLLFLVVIAICAAHLACRYSALLTCGTARNQNNVKPIRSINTTNKLLTCTTINLSIILIFTNGFFLDWMRFVECYTVLYAPATALMSLAFLFTFPEKSTETNHSPAKQKMQVITRHSQKNTIFEKSNNFSRWAKTAAMLLLSSWFYQPVLFIYLQLALGAALITSTQNFRAAIKDALTCLLVVLIVGIISIAVSKLIFKSLVQFGVLNSNTAMRESVSSLQDVKENILFVASNFKSLMRNGCDNAPKYLLPICFFVSAICLAFSLASTYRKKAHLIVALICMVSIFALAFSTHYITKAHDFSPRTLVGVYAALSSLLIATLCIKGTKKPVLAVCAAVILVALISNISLCNAGTKAELALNDQEHAYSDLVQQEIDEYERTTGDEITKIVRTSDAAPSKNMEDFGCEPFNTRSWNIAVYWTTVFMINIYENRTYEYKEMSAADKERLFGNVNYDAFDAEKQMVFEGNTLYLLVY